MKQCIRCHKFQINNQFRKNRIRPDGLEYYCIVCSRELHKNYDRKRNQLESRKASLRRATFNREYNITSAEYQTMLEKQDFKCAICRSNGSTNKRAFCVDHDHVTGKIRGILCDNCNVALGRFQDNESYLMAAIMYLKEAARVVGA